MPLVRCNQAVANKGSAMRRYEVRVNGYDYIKIVNANTRIEAMDIVLDMMDRVRGCGCAAETVDVEYLLDGTVQTYDLYASGVR